MKKEEIKPFYEKYHSKEIINPIADFMQRERCDCLRSLLRSMYGKVLVIGCVSQDEMEIINEKCDWSTPFSLREKLKKYGFKITLFRELWYYPPTGKGEKQMPHQITFPVIKLLYPFEILFRRIFHWFDHMILFKTELYK